MIKGKKIQTCEIHVFGGVVGIIITEIVWHMKL